MEIELKPDERLEDLQYKGLKFIQNKNLYCFTSDAVLLANFVKTRKDDCILDIGAGGAIISIIVASKNRLKNITAVEIQEDLSILAEKNIKLNRLTNKIQVLNKSIQDYILEASDETFDVIVSNPPYKKRGTSTINKNNSKAIARHEIFLDLKQLCDSVSKLLKFGGKFYVMYDANRTSELIYTLKNSKLEPKRMFFTQPGPDIDASLVFVEAVKGGKEDVKVLPVLFTNDQDGNYITSFRAIYN